MTTTCSPAPPPPPPPAPPPLLSPPLLPPALPLPLPQEILPEEEELNEKDADVEFDTAQIVQPRKKPPPKPSETVQEMRTLGRCVSLRRWLENGADEPKKRGRNGQFKKPRDWTKDPGKADAFNSKIRRWLLETEEGRDRLSKCDVGSCFEIDHVISQRLGGPNCLENSHIMPADHNRYFKDMPWYYPEKWNYIGDQQFQLAELVMNKMHDDYIHSVPVVCV